MSRFSSKNLVCRGIIRMHGHKTCEIPLLSVSDLPVWSSKTPMLGLQKNLVDPSKETWTSEASYAIGRIEPSLPRKIRRQSSGQAPLRHSIGYFPLPISASPQPLRRAPKSPQIALRSAYTLSRRNLVPLSKETLDFASHGTQVLQGQSSRFPRSRTSIRQRRQDRLATGVRNHSAGSQSSNSRPRRRQFKWHEENRQTRRMGASTLPFSLDSKVPNPVPPSHTQAQRRSCTRRNLSADSSSPRNRERIYLGRFFGTTDTIHPNFLWYSPHSGCGAGLPYFGKVLPHLFDTSGAKPAAYNQYGRIDGVNYPGFIATQSFGFQPSITPAMGNSIDSIKKEIKLQQQESSTDLINPTQNCDLKL